MTLSTRAGSIVDANTETRTDRDGRVVDRPNIEAINVDLQAIGGGIGIPDDDLDIDTGVANGVRTVGRLYAESEQSVYITESNFELNVLAVTSTFGEVRLTVPDTSLTPVMPRGEPTLATQLAEGRQGRVLDQGHPYSMGLYGRKDRAARRVESSVGARAGTVVPSAALGRAFAQAAAVL